MNLHLLLPKVDSMQLLGHHTVSSLPHFFYLCTSYFSSRCFTLPPFREAPTQNQFTIVTRIFIDSHMVGEKYLIQMVHSEYAPASLFFGSTLRLISTILAAFSPNIYALRQITVSLVCIVSEYYSPGWRREIPQNPSACNPPRRTAAKFPSRPLPAYQLPMHVFPV